mmetsp:Transcript_56245/g.105950  ORF Transcript_56245/g.105950 Transcript_56245/m.105950 type:complete len:207 (+) Transcript_56245:66-686(+)
MALAVGARVQLANLHSSSGSALNGLMGTIIAFVEDKDRWQVLLDGGEETKLLKALNLVRLESQGASAVEQDQPEAAATSAAQAEAPIEQATASRQRPRARSMDGGARRRGDSVGRLRRMLEEWQNANAQWQAAYATMHERCASLECENRQLREVMEAVESGPDMNVRFVARLARQNWRLGRENAAYEQQQQQLQQQHPHHQQSHWQ